MRNACFPRPVQQQDAAANEDSDDDSVFEHAPLPDKKMENLFFAVLKGLAINPMLIAVLVGLFGWSYLYVPKNILLASCKSQTRRLQPSSSYSPIRTPTKRGDRF